MARRVRAYVGLGSNTGDSAATLAVAVAALGALRGARLRAVSCLYVTRPVGVLDQPDFLNAVVALDVASGSDPDDGALALLRALKGIEADAGRTDGRRWGPRVLDLDLLVFGRARIVVERPPELAPARALASVDVAGVPPALTFLQVPHRDAADRLFVLAPLADLAPGLVPPGWHETAGTARARRERAEGAGAVRVVGDWDTHTGHWMQR